MKRTWARFEAVMKQGSEGEMAALPPGNPEGEKRGPGAVKRSTKLCSGESQSEKHDEARDYPRACGENSLHRRYRPSHSGSPPRMRGKHSSSQLIRLRAEITPAHAGKTPLLTLIQGESGITPACAGKTGRLAQNPELR